MTKLQKEKDKASTRPLAKKEESGGESFEFCEVCNLNHDQGRRHRYIPKHSRTLANTLSRFQNKLSELQFFIQNPSFLRSEHAALNSIWCVFCALDISEIGGYFVCGNAIRHLASEAHLWNLKRYLWKHGGGIDQVDLFRVSEADLLKWEKGCEALKNVASSSSEGPIGPVLGPSKEMRIIGYATQPVMAPQLLPMLTRSRFLCHWACGEMCLLITWVAWKVWTYI